MTTESASAFPCRSPLEMLESKELVKICAPMVRYSRLAFRTLVRQYGCHLAFTPMIVSDSFLRSCKARDSDFTTNDGDRPLIVQFAAKNASDLANVSEMIAPYANGVDLNCGCPQRWAMQEGYGACLIDKPELMSDMVRQTRQRVGKDDFTVSVKIRIHDDIRRTIDLCQRIEHTGAAWITVHGRTKEQRGQPVSVEAIRLIKDSVSIPVIANGDIRSLADAKEIQEATGVNGVMAARGILSNPAMFAGYSCTPLQCISDWIHIATDLGVSFQPFHNHLIYMMENVTSKSEKRVFNSLGSTTAVLDYLEENYNITYNKENSNVEKSERLTVTL